MGGGGGGGVALDVVCGRHGAVIVIFPVGLFIMVCTVNMRLGIAQPGPKRHQGHKNPRVLADLSSLLSSPGVCDTDEYSYVTYGQKPF